MCVCVCVCVCVCLCLIDNLPYVFFQQIVKNIDQVPKLSFLKNRSRETFVSEEVCMLYLSSFCEYQIY